MKEKIKKILPKSLISIYHFILAFLGALIYGFPSKKITSNWGYRNQRENDNN
jgi:hypothetical protein